MGCSRLNNDVVTEILTYVPVRSLLRLRCVSKFWLDVIDSPRFRKLHKNNEDDMVLLAYDMVELENRVEEVSVIDVDERGQLNNKFPNIQKFLNDYKEIPHSYDETKVVGPVNGLICISRQQRRVPIVVCNPFLDEVKKLPISPKLVEDNDSLYHIITHDIGIGFEKDNNYKVVQLLCSMGAGRRRLYAEVYSARTNSWRALGGVDQALNVMGSIHSWSCKPSSSLVHWLVLVGGAHAILTFDVESEVFRTRLMLPYCARGGCLKIFAKDDDTFLLFKFYYNDLFRFDDGELELEFDDDRQVKIYESRSCQGNNNLSWNYKASAPFSHMPASMTLWRRDCMVLDHDCINSMRKKLCIYDYEAQKLIGSLVLPRHWRFFRIFQYQGTFISP